MINKTKTYQDGIVTSIAYQKITSDRLRSDIKQLYNVHDDLKLRVSHIHEQDKYPHRVLCDIEIIINLETKDRFCEVTHIDNVCLITIEEILDEVQLNNNHKTKN